MNISFVSIFSLVLTVLAVQNFVIAYRAFQKSDPNGHYLGLAGFFAGIVTLSYLFSVSTDNYRHMSIASSVYFAGIDWLLISLLLFVYRYTGTQTFRRVYLLRRLVFAYGAFDTLVICLNVPLELAVSYVNRDTLIAPYAYQMKPLYILHLVFTYSLVILVVFLLEEKARRTPKQYRNQYDFIILTIAIVVTVNAIFLYQEDTSLFTLVDYSILGYSAGLFIMYWSAFSYRENDMLKSLSMTIFENIGQGIVLFDYTQKHIMHNAKAEKLLPDVTFSENMSYEEFHEVCKIPSPTRERDSYSVQCEHQTARGGDLRCDFRRLRDKDGCVIGNLYVFTDATNDTDLLTGFQHWENFRLFAAENLAEFNHPAAVVMFDIVGLGEINRSFGRDVGDQRIRSLVRLIRKYFPASASFVRGYEAHLVVVVGQATEESLRPLVEKVLRESSGTVLFGMGATSDGKAALPPVPEGEVESTLRDCTVRNIFQAIDLASRSLQEKKLLHAQSLRSQALTSLVRALQESDSDTQAHVQRTQKMGERLGLCVGLTDMQLAELNLLCLLHDIGKIGIPLEILNKPGKLTDLEWKVLRTHPEKGYQIAKTTDELRPIASMILYHHERWDGKGYPGGLAGTEIPVLSRIISVVDAYDAMVNDRAYRKGMPPQLAQEEILRCAGTQFDPFLAQEFLKMLKANPELALGEKTSREEVRFFEEIDLVDGIIGNTVPVPYCKYYLDLDDMIIDVDDTFEAITGYNRSEVLGKMNQLDLIPEEDRSDYMCQVNNQFARSSICYLEHEIQRRDGRKIWIYCLGKRYYDSAAKAYRSEIVISHKV